jgi:branched-chain amino acid transport system permease protein
MWVEMEAYYMITWRNIGKLSPVILYLVIIPVLFHDSSYILSILVNCSIMAVIAMGVWVTFSLGLVNIGQSSFCLIGGYTTGILATKLGLSIWLCLPLSGIVAALVGVLLGSAILRLKGIYFAMVTILTGEATRLLLLNGGDLTNGSSGIWDVPRPGAINLLGWEIIPAFKATDHLLFYYLSTSILVIVFFLVWRLKSSRLGKIFRGIKGSETLSSSVGINIAKYKIIAFASSCFIGGIGGAFFTTYMTNIQPGSFGLWDSINPLLYCYIGGLKYVIGPIVGTFLLSISFEVLRDLQEYQALLYACIMVVAVIWLPDGILSLKLTDRKGKKVTMPKTE